MSHDNLGDRMKGYENLPLQDRYTGQLPVICRIDGRAFSKFTRGLNRPFDERFHRAMCNTAKALVKETKALIGYTQSDEISLIFQAKTPTAQIYFGGRCQKLLSVLASFAGVAFYKELLETLPQKTKNSIPCFDCRIFEVPNVEEGVNYLIWRENDAYKNSISMLARCHFSHRALQNKSGRDMVEMLRQKDVYHENFDKSFLYGSYIKREVREISIEDFGDLPPKHHALTRPEVKVIRSFYEKVLTERRLLELDHDERLKFVFG